MKTMDAGLFEKHLSFDEILAGIDDVLRSPRDAGTLKLIVQRPAVNKRRAVEIAALDIKLGLVGDNWLTRGSRWRRGGDPQRQVTVMNWRFAKLVAVHEGRVPLAGDQLYVDLDLGKQNVPPGTRLGIGEAVIEITAPPHLGCKKFVERFGLDAMNFANSDFGRSRNLRGVNAKVLSSGCISVGGEVSVYRGSVPGDDEK